jgi:hypothetical protein
MRYEFKVTQLVDVRISVKVTTYFGPKLPRCRSEATLVLESCESGNFVSSFGCCFLPFCGYRSVSMAGGWWVCEQ